MKNLKILLKKPLATERLPKWILSSFIVVAFIGFADATFLTIEHYMNSIPPCTIEGCDVVLTSVYSEIAGIPTALAGSIYYLALIVLLIAYFDSKKEILLRSAFFLTIIGLLASIYFLILQAFVLNAFCQYCILSGITSTILFVISVYSIYKYRTNTDEK